MRKFIEAAFLDAERSVVEVLWQDGDEIYSDHIQVDPRQKTYKDFLGEANINFDDIIEMTAERRKQERKDFELAAIAIGQAEGWIPKNEYEKQKDEQIQIKTERQLREEIYKDISSTMFSVDIPEDRKVKEFMFMTKLYLFDLQKIKDHKDTKTKAALRKAKTPLEMMRHAVKLMG